MTDWDARFSEPGYAYGKEANCFLAEVADRIPSGPVLSLGEGEGRNAVFLAGLGHAVTAVDASAVGLAKARVLASERGVRITTVMADLADFRIEAGAWSGIVSVFAHLPPPLRERVHRASAAGLRPGGAFVLEAYTPAQLAFGTGGPREPSLLVMLASLRGELRGLEFEIGREIERDVTEGKYHGGRAAVVQVLARRPARANPDPSAEDRP
jgi:SAM-dependent methyltransferase